MLIWEKMWIKTDVCLSEVGSVDVHNFHEISRQIVDTLTQFLPFFNLGTHFYFLEYHHEMQNYYEVTVDGKWIETLFCESKSHLDTYTNTKFVTSSFFFDGLQENDTPNFWSLLVCVTAEFFTPLHSSPCWPSGILVKLPTGVLPPTWRAWIMNPLKNPQIGWFPINDTVG